MKVLEHPLRTTLTHKLQPITKMKNILITDFDETITAKDTTTILAKLPYKLKPNLKPEWTHFQQNYMDACKRYKKDKNWGGAKRELPLLQIIERSNLPMCEHFHSLLESEFTYQSESSIIEMASISELERCELFKGINHSQVDEYVKQLLLEDLLLIRSGFQECIQSSIEPQDFYVISVNWSREFILKMMGLNLVDPSHVFCNNLLSSSGVYTCLLYTSRCV